VKYITMLLVTLLILPIATTVLRTQKYHSDNWDGTYTHPVISADFPGHDIIRVGDTYYMITTKKFIFPEVPILKSHDLVNWE